MKTLYITCINFYLRKDFLPAMKDSLNIFYGSSVDPPYNWLSIPLHFMMIFWRMVFSKWLGIFCFFLCNLCRNFSDCCLSSWILLPVQKSLSVWFVDFSLLSCIWRVSNKVMKTSCFFNQIYGMVSVTNVCEFWICFHN